MMSSIVLLEVMAKHGVKLLVFSSSATVYGIPERVPLTEDCPLSAINPYGRTKLFQEDMFRDVAAADADMRILLLRYFNPVGAHPSGDIGEHPVGVPNNLMPYVQQVALGQREFLRVFGNDYDTPGARADGPSWWEREREGELVCFGAAAAAHAPPSAAPNTPPDPCNN